MTDPRDKCVVLLPTYNERENLGPMLHAIHEQLPDSDILVIDDNSPDGTGALADQAAVENERIYVAHRPGKQGLGVAYRFAYRWALDHDYDRIIQMDCDFSHDPHDLPRLRGLLKDYPAVIGSRRVRGGGAVGWPWYRKLLSTAGSLYARTLLSTSVRDLTAGFKGFQAEALARLPLEDLRTDGYGFQIEVTSHLLAMGFKVYEMPVRFVDRKYGESKMSQKIVLEAMMKVWSIRSAMKAYR